MRHFKVFYSQKKKTGKSCLSTLKESSKCVFVCVCVIVHASVCKWQLRAGVKC